MNDQEMKRLLQSAIDHRLSGLQENPFLARRIIAAAKGELPMKKKLSVSLILVLVLTLTVLGLAYAPVSYTHLTLPTNREVSISVGAVSLKKKKQYIIHISETKRQLSIY